MLLTTLRVVVRNATAIALAFLPTGSAWTADAAGTAPAQAAPSKEIREKMASLHEQMAACLRSDKSLAECRTQMMRGCRDLGNQTCPMMGMGGGMGMGHGHMTSPPTHGENAK